MITADNANLHHPMRVWVGGKLLPQNRGIQIRRPDHGLDNTLQIGGVGVSVWQPLPEAFYTERNHLGEYIPTQQVPLGLYVTARGKRPNGIAWRAWFCDGVGEYVYETPLSITMDESLEWLSGARDA